MDEPDHDGASLRGPGEGADPTPPSPPTPEGERARSGPAADPTRLHRSRRRLLAGVCGGLAERYDVDVSLVRVAFVVLACAWGAGVLVYLAMWALVPASKDGAAEAAPAADEPSPSLLALLLLAGAVVLGLVLVTSRWGGPGWGSSLSLVWLVLLGTLVLVALGRSGRRLARVLLVAALGLMTVVILAVGAFFGLVASTGVPLTGGIGERVVQPATLAQVQRTYRTSIGSLTVDLRRVRFAGSATLHVTASVGVGVLTVEVPPGVVVDVSAHCGVGNVQGGLQQVEVGAHHPALVLDASVGVGQVRLVRASALSVVND